ncbi:50S ribosomal protein L6 [Candidatus Uhrbacteria bacterium]|nr:50S ribosomal protein L6 [Candidatus Uhrbacteria bacterium]
MSRIGKQTIPVPSGVEVSVTENVVHVKGAKGTMSLPLHKSVNVSQGDGAVSVAVANPHQKNDRALWGLFNRLIANMVTGVTKGFQKQLEVNGVGFKVSASGSQLNLSLGFSHPVVFDLPKGVEAKIEKNLITISGIDKQLVGETTARIRALKKPEPYKGKGIKYVDEVIKRKATKAAKAGAK